MELVNWKSAAADGMCYDVLTYCYRFGCMVLRVRCGKSVLRAVVRGPVFGSPQCMLRWLTSNFNYPDMRVLVTVQMN